MAPFGTVVFSIALGPFVEKALPATIERNKDSYMGAPLGHGSIEPVRPVDEAGIAR